MPGRLSRERMGNTRKMMEVSQASAAHLSRGEAYFHQLDGKCLKRDSAPEAEKSANSRYGNIINMVFWTCALEM